MTGYPLQQSHRLEVQSVGRPVAETLTEEAVWQKLYAVSASCVLPLKRMGTYAMLPDELTCEVLWLALRHTTPVIRSGNVPLGLDPSVTLAIAETRAVYRQWS
jgi:hypothetical protein